jgi:hypothetical protein
VADDRERREALGRAARETILTRHSAAVVLPALENVYAVVSKKTALGAAAPG